MTVLLLSWLAITSVLALSAWLSIWSRTGDPRVRMWSMVVFFAGSVASLMALAATTGWSTPCHRYWTSTDGDYEILTYHSEPEVAIYLVIQLSHGPRLCHVPWSVETQEGLEKGAKRYGNVLTLKAEEKGVEGTPGDAGEGGETVVHEASPPPPNPPK